jgi:hypothetical protein
MLPPRHARGQMRAPLLLLLLHASHARAAPEYFASVANQALRLQGGPLLGGDMRVEAVLTLEQQVKRVMGADPALDLNVSALRDRPDPELLRILLLAVLGNYTSAAAPDWNRPCSLVVDPHTGLVALHDRPPAVSLSLKVVVVLLVAVQLQRKLAEARQPEPVAQKNN